MEFDFGISNEGKGTQPEEATLNAIKEAWADRGIGDDNVCAYLEEETWRGVLIGFLLGGGLSLDEAHWCVLSGEFEY